MPPRSSRPATLAQVRLSPEEPTLRPSVLTDYHRAADLIRRDIIRGVLKSNDRLKTRELAGRYGTSPVPIREALQKLEGEGLISMEPHRGARVRQVGVELISNAYDVLEAMESYFAMRFAETASPHQVALLEESRIEHDAAVATNDLATAMEVNARFHLVINSAARNTEGMAVIQRALGLVSAVRFDLGYSDRRLQAARKEHATLIDAFRRHDVEAARRHAALHVRSSRDDLISRVDPLLRRVRG